MIKQLRVNTAILDMISTKPEAVEAYEKIRVNCAICLTTEKTRSLISLSKFRINTAEIIDVKVDENVKVLTLNGGKKITAEFAAPKEPTMLIVNGGLIIEDSDKKSLDQYQAVVINGGVLHPMSFDTSNFYINGASIPYPDGAILVLQGLELTNSFIRAAVPGATYFVQGIPGDLGNIGDGSLGGGISNALKNTGLKAVEPLDLEVLKQKNIRFYTGWVTTTEENAEQLMQITEGYLGTTIIPNGCKVMQGGRLDMLAVRRFGKRIFVDGNLEIDAEDADALAAVEELVVTGKVRIADSAADAFFEKCSRYGELTVYKGEWLDIAGTEYTIDTQLLEDMADGGTFRISGASVDIAPDVAAELLSEKIHEIMLDGSNLLISHHQQNALRKKIRNHGSNVSIREQMKAEESHIEEPKAIENGKDSEEDVETTRVNCAYYKL